jgi:RND family efflux transporter MFP subunit
MFGRRRFAAVARSASTASTSRPPSSPYIAARDLAKADLEASEAFLRRAESDLERLEQAVRTNAVSQQEVTRATAERDQARAAVLGARAKLNTAEIDLAYTKMRAPVSGLISRHLVDPGNLVGRNEPTLLAAVYNVDPIYVYFEVNEQLIARFLDREGMTHREVREYEDLTKAWVQMDQVDRVYEGRLDYVDPAADPETGTVQARVVVPNKEAKLLPGFFDRLRIPAKHMDEESACLGQLGSKRRVPATDLNAQPAGAPGGRSGCFRAHPGRLAGGTQGNRNQRRK